MLPSEPMHIPPATAEDHAAMDAVAAKMESLGGDVPSAMRLQHVFHAGVYARTLFMPKGTMIVSDVIRIPTLLIVSGDVAITNCRTACRIRGYEVLTGAEMRQGIIRAFEDSYLTMVFATRAKTVEEAEAEFALRPDRLLRIEGGPHERSNHGRSDQRVGCGGDVQGQARG